MVTFYSPHHALHDPSGIRLEGHPFVSDEVPARAEAVLGAVRAAGLGPVIEAADGGVAPILAVHERGFVEFLRGVYAESAAYFGKAEPVFGSTFHPRRGLRQPKGFLGLTGYYAYGVGSPIMGETWTAAYWAAQCALGAADAVAGGERAAYALCRPPGHHAGPDLYGGFCYLNNAAVAARRLQTRGEGRVAVLDVDYHHGNGTQLIFYEDPTVLFCSVHVHPDLDYPYYWGMADETGAGAGTGFNHNIPLPLGTEDGAYLAALDTGLETIRGFAPQHLVVSAGFDVLAGDPVGGFVVSMAGLGEMARRISALNVPTVIVQEGGYVVERLGEAAVTFLRAWA